MTFVPQMRASKWYNGDMPTNLSGFINDRTNRILGWPTMRQLRVKPGRTSSLFIDLLKKIKFYILFQIHVKSFRQ